MNEPDPRVQEILDSPSYVLAEEDTALLARPELRPVRLQLELLKPEMALNAREISSTIVVFGSTRILEREALEEQHRLYSKAAAADPRDRAAARALERCERLLAKIRFYDEAREFARLASIESKANGRRYVVVTGGGPGIMEAANRGASDVGEPSVGLNITLPHEQFPNPYITPELCFQFHYFALRKMHFLLRAQALVVFPGGFGTIDELFDALTLRQTNRMQRIPIIMYGRGYWEQAVNLQFLADEGAISDEDLDLVAYADTPQEAWQLIRDFPRIESPRASE